MLRADPAARAAQMSEWLSSGRTCSAEVYKGCIESPAAAASLREQTSGGDSLDLATPCIAAYCRRFTAPVALCAGTGALQGADVAEARRVAEEFLAAKLTLDLGLDGPDPRLQSIARTYSQFWALPAMRNALDTVKVSPPITLGLTVIVDAGGFTITGRSIDTMTIPADAGKPLHADHRWDYAALERTARALKTRFPTESTVDIQIDDGIAMQVLIDTMDALAGQTCEAPAPDDPDCLFWQPTISGARGSTPH